MARTATAVATATTSTPMKTAADPDWTTAGPSEFRSPEPKIELAMAPKIATPTALPSDRANMLLPVTMPRSSQSTLDCAAISVGTASRPMPAPITKHTTATLATFGRCANAASPDAPAITNEAPSTAVRLKPQRK
jgi:hypothetical protein